MSRVRAKQAMKTDGITAALLIAAMAFVMVLVVAEFIVVKRSKGVLLVLSAMTLMLPATECLIMLKITLGATRAQERA